MKQIVNKLNTCPILNSLTFSNDASFHEDNTEDDEQQTHLWIGGAAVHKGVEQRVMSHKIVMRQCYKHDKVWKSTIDRTHLTREASSAGSSLLTRMYTWVLVSISTSLRPNT